MQVATEVEVVGDSDADDASLEGEPRGWTCERIALGKEGAVVKRIVDAKVPNQKEVEEHWVRGHVPYPKLVCGLC